MLFGSLPKLFKQRTNRFQERGVVTQLVRVSDF
ncbi:hypothetical protein BCEP4_70083 [Burkholderia cepacia]|nr:hypothetical protein BCEP4_70083 [Burkholderia cepacia]